MQLADYPIVRIFVKFIFPAIIVPVISLIIVLYIATPNDLFTTKNKIFWGVTFSSEQAKAFGLDWRQIYLQMLNDLNIKSIRIPVYWDLIEPKKNYFVFDDIKWQIEKAKEKNKSVVLAIGYKLPRWPECRKPYWASNNPEVLHQQVLSMLEKVVLEFQSYDNIIAWQVENEPFFKFGKCIKRKKGFYREEVELVRRLDQDRPIIVTDSGELSLWYKAGSSGADILGITTYRKVWNPLIGYFKWWILTPSVYQKKTVFVNKKVEQVWLMELQAEPWSHKFVAEVPLEKQKKMFSLKDLQESLEFAKKMSFPRVYLWGVEWWYFLKNRYGYVEPLNLVKKFLKDY